MGWFGNGCVFTQEPDWQCLGELPFAIRAYRHRRRKNWLLAVFKHGGRVVPEPVFSEPAPIGWARRKTTTSRLATPVRDVLDRIAKLADCTRSALLKSDYLGYLSFAAQVARLANRPVYFFAADDEMLDMGCQVSPDHFEAFALRCERSVVSRDGKTIAIRPREDDEEEPLSSMQLDRCRHIKGVEVKRLGKEDIRRADAFYGFAADLWPSDASAARKALGIGTWDVFRDLDRDFQIVIDRMSNRKSVLEVRKRVSSPTTRRAKPEKVSLSRSECDLVTRQGDLFVFGGVTPGPKTKFVDMTDWPPTIQTLDEYIVKADCSRKGLWVTLTEFPEVYRVGDHWVGKRELRVRQDPFSGDFSVLTRKGPDAELGVTCRTDSVVATLRC